VIPKSSPFPETAPFTQPGAGLTGKSSAGARELATASAASPIRKHSLGWDSYRERWVFGYTAYEITAADSFHDLPIYIGMGQASRHDSVLGLRALCELRDLYPEMLPFQVRKSCLHQAGVGFKAFPQNTPEFESLEEGVRPADYFRTDEQAPED